MKNYKKHVDDFFREKVGRANETPPPDVWNDLDKQLDGLKPTAPAASYSWLKYFALVSLVFLLFVSVIKKMSGNAANDVKNTQTEAKVNAKSQQYISKPERPSRQAAGNNEITTANSANTKETNKEEQTLAKNDQSASNEHTSGSKTDNDQLLAANTHSSGNAVGAGKALRQADIVNKTASPGKVVSAKSKLPVRPSTAGNDDKKEKNEKYASKEKEENEHVISEIKNKEKTEIVAKNGTNENNANESEITAQPDRNYGSSYNNANNKTITTNAFSNGLAAANKQTETATQPDVKKKDSIKTNLVTTGKKKNTPDKQQFKKLSEGIKAGYERGVDNYAASKYVLSPYFQFNLSPKTAIMVQPAIKYAKLSTKNVGSSQSYYNVNPDWTLNQNGNSVQTINGADTFYTTKYTYSETHDSIVKSYTVGGTYMEFELPLLLKYMLSKKLSIYGGVNFLYSTLTSITEHTYTQQGILKSVDFTNVTPALPTSLPASPDISYPGTPFASYNGPLYKSSQASQFHVGYMIGFSYECGSRLLFDLLMEQSPLNTDIKGGYNVNAPLSAPYFRLSVGYKLKNNWHPFGTGWGQKDYGRGD